MKHVPPIVALVGLILGGSSVAADVIELEKTVQEAIRKAEPSIACILVSRSPLYKQYEMRQPPTDKPGWLGEYPRVRNDELHHPGGEEEERRREERRKLDMSHPDYVPESYGSGIVIDQAGLILTNAHVVRGAVKVFVRLPGNIESYADIHALDTRSDLAVLKLNGKFPPLKPITLSDGSTIKKGQFAIALANPFAAGFRDGEPSASFGLVSNLRRRIVNLPNESDRRRLCLSQFATLIMTDCRLALGSSGGALINLKGELIAVTTSQAALSGVETPGGFALPLDVGVKRIIEVLQRGEEVEYGFLGVRFSPTSRGVHLTEVIKQSPADRGGLMNGDYILSADGVPVRDTDDIFVLIGTLLSGNTIEIERSRTPTGPGQKVRVTLAKYQTQQAYIASNRPRAFGGLRVDNSSLAVQRGAFPPSSVPDGVLIRDVEPGSPADRARLQPDRIISHINGRPVLSPREFSRMMADLHGDVELTLRKAEGGFDKVTLKID
jgi:S1-C subfamily serine protease